MTWQPYWHKTKSFAHFVVTRFLADECRQNAASLTYTTLFAVVPMMTVVFSILAAIPSLKHVSTDIQNFIFKHFIPDTGIKIQNYLSDFSYLFTTVSCAIRFKLLRKLSYSGL